MRTYTRTDLACYGHASLGKQHVKNRLANLVWSFNEGLAAALRRGEPREPDALALINEQACCKGVHFTIDTNGDLYLTEDT